MVAVDAEEMVNVALSNVERIPVPDAAISRSPSRLIKGILEVPAPGGKPCKVSALIAYPTFAMCWRGVISASVATVTPRYTSGFSVKTEEVIALIPQSSPTMVLKIPSWSGVTPLTPEQLPV